VAVVVDAAGAVVVVVDAEVRPLPLQRLKRPKVRCLRRFKPQ